MKRWACLLAMALLVVVASTTGATQEGVEETAAPDAVAEAERLQRVEDNDVPAQRIGPLLVRQADDGCFVTSYLLGNVGRSEQLVRFRNDHVGREDGEFGLLHALT